MYISVTSFFIFRYSKNAFFSYFLFFVQGYFIFNTTMRQCFALSFFIIALYFAINRKLLFYLIFVALAVSFHSSAVVIIPIYWLLKLRLSKRLYIITALSTIVVSVIATILFPYVEQIFHKEYILVETGGEFTILGILITAILGIYYYDRIDSSNRVWLLLLLFYFVLVPISKLSPAFFRINLYFAFFAIILIPNIAKVKTATVQIFVIFMILSGLVRFIYINNQAGIRVFPYVYYWEDYYKKNPDAKRLDLY